LIGYRGFYAISDRMTPVRISLAIVAVNLALNMTLVCLLGGVGLAIGGAVSAALQAIAASLLLQRRVGRLDWREIMQTAGRTLAATAAMSIACVAVLEALPHCDSLP